MKLTFLPIRAFAPILFLTAFLGFASPVFAGHCALQHDRVAKHQFTGLHCAARTNDATKAEELIRAGADLNARIDYTQLTPLHSTTTFNGDKVAALLIRAGADVDARDRSQETPLHGAAYSNLDKIAALLIRAGADVDARDDNQWTPLYTAAINVADKVAVLLIRAGADVNARDKRGKTPLDVASDTFARLIRNPQEAIALANKIDPPPTGEEAAKIAREAKKRKAKRQAAEAARLESEKQEAERQAQEAAIAAAAAENSPQEESEPTVSDPSPERGTSAAVAFAESLRAQKSESPAAAPPKTALPAAAPPQAAPPEAAPQAANPAQAQIVVDGACDLCDAVKLGDAEIIALLLQAGHDPNARDASGKTVLSYAIQSQRVDIVRMLTKGVDAPPPPPETPPQPEAPPPPDPAVLRTAEEDSALKRARSADSLEEWLAFAEGEFGDGKYAAIAKAELREITEESFRRHRTALHFAADHNDIQQAEMLLRAGANPNAQTDRGFTPLMFAAKKSNLEIVKMLLDYGANPKLRERNRKNALDYVRGENGYAIREMIKKWRPSQ